VIVRSHSDEPVEFTISKKGGIMTAGDLNANGDVEIVNSDLPIMTIDDPETTVTLTVVVTTGRGYQTLEESTTARPHSDMIALDAMYSPVKRVRYSVDDARVGDNVDLDKLTVTIDTDGTISPVDAFEQANAILMGQYKALAGKAAEAFGGNDDDDDSTDASGLLDMPIEELGLSARTTNALISNEIRTVNDLVSLTDEEMDDLKGFGAKAKEEVKARVAELEF
jgi:DNA-directed RNA polymerase subunit alpha